MPGKRQRTKASGAPDGAVDGEHDVIGAMDVQLAAPAAQLDDDHEPPDGGVEWELEPADVAASAPAPAVLHPPADTNAGPTVYPSTDAPDPQLGSAEMLALAPLLDQAAKDLADEAGSCV